ncbi:MAG: DEAD/DEAH box helicase [Cyanobacteria bacterium J06641_5]
MITNPHGLSLQAPAEMQAEIATLRQSLRSGQRELADWQGGPLAVSAVPGAGKSTGMAIGAAIAIARFGLHPQRQLVVVTFTRSAAASIKSKIRENLRGFQLPQGGFVAHTLHSLALNIASRHPELARVDLNVAEIMTSAQSRQLRKAAVEQWLSSNPALYKSLLEGRAFDGEETEYLRRQSALRTEILPSLASVAISEAKSSGIQPQDLQELARRTPEDYRILLVAAGIYEQYERLRRSRDLIDYDDMIVGALQALTSESVRRFWQRQYFAVFEDEAQDSSPLQARLLHILASDPENPAAPANLVRVGDPNQAINSTFTPADPAYFRSFCQQCQARDRFATMDRAGRSSPIIIGVANYLVSWVNERTNIQTNTPVNTHTDDRVEEDCHTDERTESPFRKQFIHPVAPDDPQPNANPMAWGGGVEVYQPEDIFATVKAIGNRAIAIFSEHPTATVAVLVREHRQGRFVAEQLAHLQRERNIQIYEASTGDRQLQIPTEIYQLLKFLDRPHSPACLQAALEVLIRRGAIATLDPSHLAANPEHFLYPGPLELQPTQSVQKASRFCRSLLRACLELPHYHLIAFLGLALRYSGTELATVQKLAARVTRQNTYGSSLKSTLAELSEIVSSEKFEAVETDNDDRYNRPGQIAIVTMHKAKGLEWDAVFLPFLHEDAFPGKPWVPVGAKFLGEFTLAEVARLQIRTAMGDRDMQALPTPEQAWAISTNLKAAEEYRLLYVAMTRAKQLLWLSAAARAPFRWHSFNSENTRLQDKKATPALRALQKWLRERL